MRIKFLIIALVMCIAGIAGARNTVDRVVAKVNEDIITESDLAEIAAERSHRSGSSRDAISSESFGALIDRTLLLQEAKKQKVGVPDDELQEEVEGLVKEIRDQFPSEAAFREELSNNGMSLEKLKSDLLKKSSNDYKLYQAVTSRYSISDADAERFEKESEAKGQAIAQYKLRRLAIKVDDRGEAFAHERVQTVLARMQSENLSFEEGVKEYSEAPGAKDDAGEMQYMTLDQLAPELRSALKSLDRGKATKAIRTGEFLSVFYIQDRRGARSVLSKKRFESERLKLLEELRRNAHIHLYDPKLAEVLPDHYQSRVENSATSISTDSPRESREIYSATQDLRGKQQLSEAQPTPKQKGGIRSFFQRKKE